MSFSVGAVLWFAVGVWLMTWWREADQQWQRELTRIGVMPEGPETREGAIRHPIRGYRRWRTSLDVALPFALRTSDRDVETWRIRRSRRRSLLAGWAVGGWIVAFLVAYILDAAQDDARWALALVPIAGGLVYGLLRAHEYGNATEEVGIPGSTA